MKHTNEYNSLCKIEHNYDYCTYLFGFEMITKGKTYEMDNVEL